MLKSASKATLLVIFKEEAGETPAKIPLTNISPVSYTDLPRFLHKFVWILLWGCQLMSPAVCLTLLLVLAQQPWLPCCPTAVACKLRTEVHGHCHPLLWGKKLSETLKEYCRSWHHHSCLLSLFTQQSGLYPFASMAFPSLSEWSNRDDVHPSHLYTPKCMVKEGCRMIVYLYVWQ